MAQERYIARCIQHWHVVLIGADGKETVMEITDSEESAMAEAARLHCNLGHVGDASVAMLRSGSV